MCLYCTKITFARTFIWIKSILRKLVLHSSVYIFLVYVITNNEFMVTIHNFAYKLEFYRGLRPSTEWVSKNVKILNRSISITGLKKTKGIPRVMEFG